MIDLGMKEKLVRWLNSLTAKYVAVFVLLVAVPAIGISWYLLDSSYNDNKRALINQQRAQAQAIAGRIDQTLQDVLDRLGSVHGKGAKPEQVRTSLRPLILSALTPLMAFYMNGRGTDVASVGARALHVVRLGEETTSPLPTLSRAEFEQAQNGDFVSGVRPYIDSSTNQSIPMFYVATVENYGFGVVGEALAGRSTFGSLLSNARLGHGYAYAVAENGRTLDYPARLFETGTDELTDKSSQLPRTLSLPQVEDALHSSEPVGSATGENLKGTRVLSAWAVVPTARWKVFVEQPESAAFAPLRGKIWKTALLIAAFVAAAVALSILVARRLVRPIKRMRLAAARIGAGAYDERIELDPRRTVTFRGPPDVSLRRRRGLPFRGIEDPGSVVVAQPLEERTRQDDLGALAEDLNRMAASLQKSHAELEQKVDERTRELQATLEQLAIKSRELEDASKHKSEFLANMSHELRTPLNAIIGFSQVLQQKLFGEVNAKQEEYLEDIHGSANHLLALINDVLDLSKVEAGQVELEKAPFSLREALERGVVMVRERAVKNGVQLTLEIDPSVELVTADERRIRQVVFNLLSNAVKFTPQGGSVVVGSAQENGEVLVSVTDTGPGIAPQDQERIFEEFQQTEVGQEQREGTGLGLALSRKLVELHGGRIWVESEPGRGSTFTFTLPVGVQYAGPDGQAPRSRP